MYRKQIRNILADLQKKMVFLIGPRQVGKTWLALEVGKKFNNTTYLNYDYFEDREIIQKAQWHEATELLILDEIHKMPGWKNHLKGIYDTKPEQLKILVTGSARLDYVRYSGDSLAGRFFIHHLLPFSLAELKDHETGKNINHFIERGGFPEPFLAAAPIDVKRWRNQYIESLIRFDVLDFKKISDLRTIQTIFELLRRRIGSPVSYASIARDVNSSPPTVMKYIQIMESLYIIFRITPYSRNIARSVLKEPKIYFYDNGLVIGDEGAKLENFVAVSLLKHVLARNDLEGENMALQYLRTKNGKEVDFCLTNEDRLTEILEVKNKDANLSKNLIYFCDKYQLKGVQLVKELKREKTINSISVRRADNYLRSLYL